jgi:hypothetical protein
MILNVEEFNLTYRKKIVFKCKAQQLVHFLRGALFICFLEARTQAEGSAALSRTQGQHTTCKFAS